MAERIVEVLAGLFQEVHHALVVNLCAQGQRVDEHSCGIAYAQVAAASGDGGDADLLVVGEARQRVENGSEREMRGRKIVLLAEVLDSSEVHSAEDLAGGTLLHGIGQV